MKALLVVLSVLLLASAATMVRSEEEVDEVPVMTEHEDAEDADEELSFLQTDEDEDEEDEDEDEQDEEVDTEALEEYFLEAGTCGCNQAATAVNEGKRLDCYYDTKKIPTIGVGFNLNNGNAASLLKSVGVSTPLATIKANCGKKIKVLTEAQMLKLFDGHYKEGVACAKKLFPAAPPCVSAGLADMALNLGCGGLGKFTRMIADLKAKKWADAVKQAKSAAWCKQVGGRCGRTTACLATGA